NAAVQDTRGENRGARIVIHRVIAGDVETAREGGRERRELAVEEIAPLPLELGMILGVSGDMIAEIAEAVRPRGMGERHLSHRSDPGSVRRPRPPAAAGAQQHDAHALTPSARSRVAYRPI